MILAIGHEAGVGKDTFAMFLIDYLRSKNMRGLVLQREGFVTKLYQVCHLFYGWAGFQTREYYDQHPDEKQKVLPLIGKAVFQILEDMSDKLTEYDKQIFYNALIKTKGHHLKIIPDIRRPLEFDQAKRDGVFLMRIKKTGYVSPRKFCQYLLPYADQWDLTITNDGTLGELREKAIAFADEVVIPRIQAYLHGGAKP